MPESTGLSTKNMPRMTRDERATPPPHPVGTGFHDVRIFPYTWDPLVGRGDRQISSRGMVSRGAHALSVHRASASPVRRLRVASPHDVHTGRAHRMCACGARVWRACVARVDGVHIRCAYVDAHFRDTTARRSDRTPSRRRHGARRGEASTIGAGHGSPTADVRRPPAGQRPRGVGSLPPATIRSPIMELTALIRP